MTVKNLRHSQNKRANFALYSTPYTYYKIRDIHIMKVQLTKQFDFEMAHALMNYDGQFVLPIVKVVLSHSNSISQALGRKFQGLKY